MLHSSHPCPTPGSLRSPSLLPPCSLLRTSATRLSSDAESLVTYGITAPKSDKELSRIHCRVSCMFSGTQDKCAGCNKTAYPLEKIYMEGSHYHKNCFKCSHGGCIFTPSNHAALDGILYYKHHFLQLFKEKGSYHHGPIIRKSLLTASQSSSRVSLLSGILSSLC